MLGAVWLCLSAVTLTCWAYPSHSIICDKFVYRVSFDPKLALGEWFTVYSFTGAQGNSTGTEKIIIRQLTSSQLDKYDDILSSYSDDKLKFEFKIYVSRPIVFEVNSVLVALDEAGNVDAWLTLVRLSGATIPLGEDLYAPYSMKWKRVDNFLVLMMCNTNNVYVLSKSIDPDDSEVRQVVEKLHTQGLEGGRINSSML